MGEEIEKKFVISAEKFIQLRKNGQHKTIGIIQWYVDGVKDQMKSERIRMILNEDRKQQWIMGKKECIDGSLIHRSETETTVKHSPIDVDDLHAYPFIIKSRTILSAPFHAEIVLDKLLENPYLTYDVDHLLEVELKDGGGDIEDTAHEVLAYFDLGDLKDVSKDFSYTNQAIALRAYKNRKKGKIEFPILLNILKKEIRSDSFENK